jgi:hypothetical protein
MVYLLLGCGVLFVPLIPGLREIEAGSLLCVLCAFLFFFLGALARHSGRLEAHVVELAELLDDLARDRYGESYYAVRQTIPFLIEQLRVQPAASHGPIVSALEGLTRCQLGGDAERWQEWWDENRAGFQPPAARSSGSGSAPADGSRSGKKRKS